MLDTCSISICSITILSLCHSDGLEEFLIMLYIDVTISTCSLTRKNTRKKRYVQMPDFAEDVSELPV